MFELLEFGLCNKYFPGSTLHVVISVFAVLLTGYLLGSLNFAVIISKVFYRGDIRNLGSGNAGATNMLRTYGKLPAALIYRRLIAAVRISRATLFAKEGFLFTPYNYL